MKIKITLKHFFLVILFLTNLSIYTLAQKMPADVVKTKSTKAEVIGLEKSELTTKDITQNRDLTKYEQGGYFDCRSWAPEEDDRGECNEKKIRDFIWLHWTEKKRGYIRVTRNSVDAQSTSHIFIEPNNSGKWRAVWRIVRLHAIPELSNQITEVETLFQVERVENKQKKDDWTIVLKNSKSVIIYKIP